MATRRTRGWIRPLVITVMLTVATLTFAMTTGMGPDVLALAALCLLTGTMVWFVTDSLVAAPPGHGVVLTPLADPRARTDRRVMSLRNGIAYGRASDVALEQLHETLVDLIDDQLRALHDVDRASDPVIAAAILGSELTAFVDDPDGARTLATPWRLERIITQIERL